MSGKMDAFGATHVGRKRSSNQDQFLIADLNKSLRVHHTSLSLDHQTQLFGGSQGKLLLVADGMGGHEAGERASTLAVDGIVSYTLNTLHWMYRLDEENEDDFQADLKAAMEHCQEVLAREMRTLPQHRGMGTTLTIAYIIWPRLYVVHVGDSRCYVFRNGRLTQLTRDHTAAQLYRESQGQGGHDEALSDEPEPDLPGSHILWNVIGGKEHTLHPEVHRTTLALGDTLLLCTDGLTRHVSKKAISDLLRADASAKQICHQLITQANEHGGSDNITVVVARFRQPTDEGLEEVAEEVSLKDETEELEDTAPRLIQPARAQQDLVGDQVRG